MDRGGRIRLMDKGLGALPPLALRGVTERHRGEGDRQQAARHHRHEDTVPAPAVGDPADAGTGDRGAEHVAEEAGEAGRGARRLLRHEIEGVQTDDHDRSVDQEADRDERRVVDPQRPLDVEPVDDDGDERQGHEQHVGGRPPALEVAVRHEAAGDRARDGRVLVERPRGARLPEREALRRLEVGRDPVHDAVADEVDEGVGHGDRPQVAVLEDVAEEDLAETEDPLVVRAVVGG